MARIYWFTGVPDNDRDFLSKKLHEFLKTEKRNWRKDVFYISMDTLGYKTSPETIKQSVEHTILISKYLLNYNCDVVVSLISPNKKIRDQFKEEVGFDNFQEIYTHSSPRISENDYLCESHESPDMEYIDVDLSKVSLNVSFSRLINNLNKLDKL